jgi:hypothetical protein
MVMSRPLARRYRDDPGKCGCPLTHTACELAVDGEDLLCAFCRNEHRPDFRQPFEEDDP